MERRSYSEASQGAGCRVLTQVKLALCVQTTAIASLRTRLRLCSIKRRRTSSVQVRQWVWVSCGLAGGTARGLRPLSPQAVRKAPTMISVLRLCRMSPQAQHLSRPGHPLLPGSQDQHQGVSSCAKQPKRSSSARKAARGNGLAAPAGFPKLCQGESR